MPAITSSLVLPPTVAVKSGTDLRQIPIVRVARRGLVMPLQFARAGVEHDQRIGVELVPGRASARKSGAGLATGT